MVFFHFAWSEFDISKCLLYDQWVCSTISHCSQLQGNLVDSWSYTLVAYIVVIRRKFPNESSYHNTEQTALTLVIYKICPSLYYNFQIQWRRTNLAVIEVNEQRCIHIFFFFFIEKIVINVQRLEVLFNISLSGKFWSFFYFIWRQLS